MRRLAKRIELAKRIDHRHRRQHAEAKAKFACGAVGREKRRQVQIAPERAPRPAPVTVKVVTGHGETGKGCGRRGTGVEQFAQAVHLRGG